MLNIPESLRGYQFLAMSILVALGMSLGAFELSRLHAQDVIILESPPGKIPNYLLSENSPSTLKEPDSQSSAAAPADKSAKPEEKKRMINCHRIIKIPVRKKVMARKKLNLKLSQINKK